MKIVLLLLGFVAVSQSSPLDFGDLSMIDWSNWEPSGNHLTILDDLVMNPIGMGRRDTNGKKFYWESFILHGIYEKKF